MTSRNDGFQFIQSWSIDKFMMRSHTHSGSLFDGKSEEIKLIDG